MRKANVVTRSISVTDLSAPEFRIPLAFEKLKVTCRAFCRDLALVEEHGAADVVALVPRLLLCSLRIDPGCNARVLCREMRRIIKRLSINRKANGQAEDKHRSTKFHAVHWFAPNTISHSESSLATWVCFIVERSGLIEVNWSGKLINLEVLF